MKEKIYLLRERYIYKGEKNKYKKKIRCFLKLKEILGISYFKDTKIPEIFERRIIT